MPRPADARARVPPSGRRPVRDDALLTSATLLDVQQLEYHGRILSKSNGAGKDGIACRFDMNHCILVDGDAQPVDAQDGETILDALLRNGVGFPYSCQAGNCGSCKCEWVSGEIFELDPQARGALDDAVLPRPEAADGDGGEAEHHDSERSLPHRRRLLHASARRQDGQQA